MHLKSHLIQQYTLNGKIPIRYRYADDSQKTPLTYNTELLERYLKKAKKRKSSAYGKTDQLLYQALDKYNIQDQQVGIIGSVRPFYEAVCITYGGTPITVEYNEILCEDNRLKAITPQEWRKAPFKFDSILSISSIEHDGLGRYGDPINPNGDIEAMHTTKEMLKKGGILFLSVPCGPDAIEWNRYRVYGPIRLPMLISQWKYLETFGSLEAKMWSHHNQPILVLQNGN